MSVDVPSVEERGIWFGPKPTPRFGWLASPADGFARGGIVLAPPVGREARAARRALRRCAIALARRGFVALRLDYAGTGDAGGAIDDPDLDRAWTDSVADAVALLRSCGLSSASAVGMRIGATVLGAAVDAHDLGLSSLVLWDPCESGRGYLRELSALEALRRERVDSEGDGAVVTSELVFSERTAGELRRLRLATVERRPLADRVLVVVRSDRTLTDDLQARLELEHVEWLESDDQQRLLDADPLHAVMPDATIERVTQWLAATPDHRDAYKEPPDARTSIVLDEGTTKVSERVEHLGPSRLFGIIDEPLEQRKGPLVVFLNVSNEEHTGPSRLWVELSRRWAAAGLQCLRFDLSGLGDSWQPGEAEPSVFEQRWLTDMCDAARAVRPDDPSGTVFVGLCSGAYLAIEAGLALRSRGVCAINPPVGVDFLHGTARLGASRHRAVRAGAPPLKEFALRLRWVAVVVWKFARVIMPSVFARDAMAEVASGGTDLFVLASAEDLSPASSTRRLDRFFSRRLVAPRHYAVTFVPGLDHSMHAPVGRRRVVAMLDEHVRERFADAAPTDGPVDELKERR